MSIYHTIVHCSYRVSGIEIIMKHNITCHGGMQPEAV